jgi:TetR/AcrR family transcriptional regulator, regulator of cefoperazone and chloramphenicol sensitivity
MKPQREDAVRTRHRLLVAASEVFADKGYRDATIAEICSKAEANVAAVNYHFRDKESLYRGAWRQSLIESLKAHPPDGGVSPDASPEDRLRGQIKALLERVSDRNNKELSIMLKEMASPTGLLEEVIREEIQPLAARIEAIIRELLGPEASDSQIKFCGISIFSQCINPAVIRRGEERDREQDYNRPRVDDIAAYTDHVITFSLGGIRALMNKANPIIKRKPKR